MKKGLVASIVALLSYVNIGLAQEGSPLPPGTVINEGTTPLLTDDSWGEARRTAPRFWVSSEYLHWWITRGPVGVPLVTTGDFNAPGPGEPGAIGRPDTRILFGNSSIDYGGFNGGRISMGYWFGDDSRWGIEASGFLFGQCSSSFSATSDASGNPYLAVPFQDLTGMETARAITLPLRRIPFTGGVRITSSSRLWGTDFNGVLNVRREGNLSVDLLAGFRYYDLQESLQMDTDTHFKIPGIFTYDRNTLDRFGTRNQFYGGQFGSRASYQAGRFSVDALGLLAMGSTQQTLSIAGSTEVVNNPPGFRFVGQPRPYGILTRPSNIGTFHTSSFSVVPQMQLKLGYDITRNIRATVGYDALYWTNVLRPGNQIDHVVGNGLPGETRPAPMSNRSDLWAHGFNVGLGLRW